MVELYTEYRGEARKRGHYTTALDFIPHLSLNACPVSFFSSHREDVRTSLRGACCPLQAHPLEELLEVAE